MKFYQMFTLLVLSSLLTYEAQGIRLGKVTAHQGSSRDDQLLAKTAEFSSGMNRKLMTENRSSSSMTSISKNQKSVGNKHDMKPDVQSTHWKKEVVTEHYPDLVDIAGMDYTPARKKSPIHN